MATTLWTPATIAIGILVVLLAITIVCLIAAVSNWWTADAGWNAVRREKARLRSLIAAARRQLAKNNVENAKQILAEAEEIQQKEME
jgi:hypothetical protein